MKFPNLWKVVGGIPTEKYESQLGVLFPTEWKNNPNVPNHQPDKVDEVDVSIRFSVELSQTLAGHLCDM